MIGCRFANFGSPLSCAGLVASIFLPLSLYGSGLTLIQGRMPDSMRSTIIAFTMLCLNVLALALGNLAAGAAGDHLVAQGHPAPLTTVLVAMGCVVGLSMVCFLAAARLTAT